MPILEVRHMPGDDLKSEKGSILSYTRVLTVRHTDQRADNLTVLKDPRLPQEGQRDPWNSACIIVASNAKRRKQSLVLWDVTLTTTNQVDENQNPLNQPAKWSVATVLYEVPVIRDRKKNYLRNTAGDLIEGAKDSELGFTFSARFSLPDEPLDWLKDFGNTLNDAPVTIKGIRCEQETVWLRHFELEEPRREYGVIHCPGRATFEYKPSGWPFEPLNQGWRELVEETVRDPRTGQKTKTRKLVECLDANGKQVSQKVFLDQDGRQYRVKLPGPLVGEQLKAPLDPSDIIILRFDVKKLSSFRALKFLR